MRAAWLVACLTTAALLAPQCVEAQAKPGTRAQTARNDGQDARVPRRAGSPGAAQVAAQKTLAETRARIKRLADEQKRLEGERDAAASELRRIDEVVAEAQRSLHGTEAAIAAQERALVELQLRRGRLEQALSKQRAELAALVRSAYALGRNRELQLLLEQDRVSDLARVLAYHRYFERARTQKIGRVNAELEELATVATQIEQRKAGLIAAQARQRGDAARLAAQKRERGKVVATLDARYRDRSARLGALGRDEKNTVALLERLRKLMAQLPKPVPPVKKPIAKPARPGAASQGSTAIRAAAASLGPMSLPLAGSILAGYRGTMPDGHQSQGLLIAGSAGAKVHAVRAGRVAYADWLKGYGLLLILDHGNGWMSLYAFNDALLKNTGEDVQAGEAISTVGSSGGQGRPALYFELRHNGQPADPAGWLRR